MTWLPWISLDRRIRELLAEHLEHGVTEQLDKRLATLIAEQKRVERAGCFS